MTMNEMATICANMNEVLNIPLIGDIDTGYGNPLNVHRTVRELNAPAWRPFILRTRCSRNAADI
jgi:methylisocitrate lyase